MTIFASTTLFIGYLAYANGELMHVKNAIIATFEQEDVTKDKIVHAETIEQEVTREKATIKKAVQLEVPLIEQMPELPRGCEVTALSMLLAFHHIEVDKMTLAEEVERNTQAYSYKDGQVHFGNPYNGFVGSMYTFDEPGLGVYHGPIASLAKKHATNLQVIDFTGEDFKEVKRHVSEGHPVWVIINSHYKHLPKEQFETWQTEDGPLDITYRQHAVLITGYDEEKVYFNDPLNYRSSAPIKDFIAAWEQMGKQSITMYE